MVEPAKLPQLDQRPDVPAVNREVRRRITADMRLRILQIVRCAPAYSTNARLLCELLDLWGHRAAIEAVLSEVAWLQEQGVVNVRHTEFAAVVELTDRGLAVATGAIALSGVAKPGPGELHE